MIDKMKKFTCVQDIGDLKSALAEAFEIQKDRFKYVELGRNKTLMMIFFNSSLRTRLSTQKAALNLGMNVMVLDINQGAWKLETERGVIMDGDKPEHLLEAIPVMGCYCDIIGVRSFARFENRDYDYEEVIINQFIKYSVLYQFRRKKGMPARCTAIHYDRKRNAHLCFPPGCDVPLV
jgi:N-succinyl-L-ornithine transcarbamylase